MTRNVSTGHSVIEEIKSRLDIVEIVGETVPLRRSGKNYIGFCPFHHNVRTPAFAVFPDTQTWRCFGACNTGGDVFQFVMKRDGLSFSEALRVLAERAGVPLAPKTPEMEARERERARLREALAAAALFYQSRLLESPEAEPARAYLADRGLARETIERFGLGYSPGAWHALLDYLKGRGFSTEELRAAGLIVVREDGTAFDRFRGRLMIPIRDPQGHVIGFGARALSGEEPKYLNSPQTPLFDKSAVLFALDLARAEIRRTGTAVIVEGYFDAIMAHQAGFANVVAALGTSLSEAQLRQLRRWTRRLVLALDADPAGMHAVLKGIASAREAFAETSLELGPRGPVRLSGQIGVDLRVLTLPEGMDPDELIRRDPQAWARAVETARPVVAFLLDYLAARFPLEDPKGKAAFAREAAPILAAIPDPIERAVYIQQAARMARINERVLLEQVAGRRMEETKRVSRKASASAQASKKAEKERTPRGDAVTGAEAMLLVMLGQAPDLLPYLHVRFAELGLDPLSEEDFSNSTFRALFRNIAELGPVEEWPEEAGEPLLRTAWERLLDRYGGLARGFDPENVRWAENAVRYALWIRERQLKETIANLHALMKEIPEDHLREFMEKWQQLAVALNRVQRSLYRRAPQGGRPFVAER